MRPRKFRKLHISLPVQPVVNQRPWLITGWLLAAAFLLIAACIYFSHKKSTALPGRQGKIVFGGQVTATPVL